MADEMPGAGGPKLDRNKKIMIVVGGVGIAGVLWWRQRSAAAAAAAAVPSGATSTDSGTDLSDYGNDASLNDEGDLGYDDSADLAGLYGTGSGALSGISSNADWYAAALQAAENVGYDPATAATALSAYLAAQPLTTQQQQIVQVGLAAAGTPPMGTFTIIPEPTGTTTTTPPAGGTTTTPVTPTKAPGGLRVTSLGTNTFTIGWDGQPAAQYYYVYVNSSKAGPLYGTLWTVNTGNQGTAISPGGKYTVSVTAVDKGGTESAHSAPLSVTTKAK